MKNLKVVCMLVALLCCITAKAQNDSIGVVFDSADTYTLKPKGKTRNVIGLTPNKRTKKINGLAIGLLLAPGQLIAVNGINIELLGIGFVAPVPITRVPLSNVDSISKLYFGKHEQKVNGFTASLLGHYNQCLTNGVMFSPAINQSNTINGICVGGWGNYILRFNGIEAAVIANESSKGRGLQIGLFNACHDLRGLQIGLWNKNGKRSLPLINWQFTR